ncbi:MAG: PGPGW domain-containing protein, partial [Myxococcota bacterium]
LKVTFVVIAIVCFAAGVVLVFIPGPAVLFFALGGALLATQSLWVARALDAIEVRGRKTLDSIRRR